MAGPVAGRNRTAASRSACHSSSVRSISAAATLLSSCATLDAPGIATTAGLLISQASATCEKPGVVGVGHLAQHAQQPGGPLLVDGQEQRVDIDGARHVHPGHLETARAFRIPPATRLVRIILPSAAPKILAGLRLSLALALVMMIVSEFVGSTNGIGREMLQDTSLFNVSGMWSVIVLLGLLGMLLNGAFGLLERRVLAWQRTDGPAA